jgi:hypothetical protein
MTTTIWIAEFDTRHFTFTAVGEDRAKALKALQKGLYAHAKTHGLPSNWWWGDGYYASAQEALEDCNVDEVPLGGCLNDHVVISGA